MKLKIILHKLLNVTTQYQLLQAKVYLITAYGSKPIIVIINGFFQFSILVSNITSVLVPVAARPKA